MEKPAEMAGFSGHYLVALTTTEWTAYVIDSTNTYNLVGRKIAPIVAPNSKKIALGFPRVPAWILQHNFRRLRFLSVALTTCVASACD
jgi:hypothetical protein